MLIVVTSALHQTDKKSLPGTTSSDVGITGGKEISFKSQRSSVL